jgi:hypothetical protein
MRITCDRAKREWTLMNAKRKSSDPGSLDAETPPEITDT